MSGERDDYSERCDQHEEVVREYIKHETIAQTRYEDLIKEYKKARSVLISSGAFKVDDGGNIILGWYNKPSRESDGAKVGVAAGAASIGAAIGTPVAAWTLVGAFGTASTGAAIGGLSGAAATGATAAWFGGGSLATGGLGVAAAPFVLSGIGIVAGGGVLLTAVALAARKRNASKEARNTHIKQMDEAERRLEANRRVLECIESRSADIGKRLIQRAAVLEEVKTDQSVNDLSAVLHDAEDLIRKCQEELPHTRIYICKPSKVVDVEKRATTTEVSMTWADPDDGSSEISEYQIDRDGGSFVSRFHSIATTTETHFTDTNVEPGKTYTYRITAVNPLGQSERSDLIRVETPESIGDERG